MTDEQRAREFVDKLMEDAAGPNTGSLQGDSEAWPGSGIHETELASRLAALLASRALEEAKWWEHLAIQAHEESCGSKTSFDPKGCMYCERIAALEQAAAGKAAGGGQ